MNGLFEGAKEICGFLASRGWPYCIIGGLAVQQCELKEDPEMLVRAERLLRGAS